MMMKLMLLFFVVFLQAQQVILTKEQREWLNNLKTPIKIGITQIPNQVLKTKNGYEGFSIDLFNLFKKKLNIKFEYIYFDTWQKLLKAAKDKKIDVIFLAQKTPSRLKYFYFTDTVLPQQNKIIVNINNNEFMSLEQLNGKKVAVTYGSAIEEYLSYFYPNIILLHTKSEIDSLRLLNESKVSAVISEAVRSSYYIKKYDFDNLLISNTIPYSYYLRIATINQKPILNIILTKAVESSQEEIKALQLKWGYIQDKIVLFDKKSIFFIFILFILLLGFIIYKHIITQQLQYQIKQKEEILKRLKILKDSRLNQMSDMISMIAHQWKQPLNNISLMNQLIVMRYKDNELNNEIIDYFDLHTNQQIELLLQTINDFRDFFKIEEQQQKFNVKEVIENSIKLVKPIFEIHNIKIDFYYEDDNYYSFGYPNALKQIILNLLNNSKDILMNVEKDKKVKITLSKKDEIILSIEDNGGGIDIEIIDRVFEPYFTTKKNKNGTGLGLYMAKILIEEKMNGSIEVKNGINGANFEIKLPLFQE